MDEYLYRLGHWPEPAEPYIGPVEPDYLIDEQGDMLTEEHGWLLLDNP